MDSTIDNDFDFRALLLKIQDSLSDEDRIQLHFVFGNDIPRTLQSDGSLEASLQALEKLMERSKFSKDNINYLVRSLEAIHRLDCAERLKSSFSLKLIS